MNGNQPERVAVLVDHENVYYSARDFYGSRIDYKILIDYLVGSRKLVHASSYLVKHTEQGEAFLKVLRTLGVTPYVKNPSLFTSGKERHDWDMGIAIAAILAAEHADTIVLVTGDGDFVPVVKYLQQNRDKRVEAASFRGSASARLRSAVDKFYDLDLLGSVLLRQSNATGLAVAN